MAKDNEGNVALTALLDLTTGGWKASYRPEIPSKVATLLRHGASPDLQGSSYFHLLSTRHSIIQDYKDKLNCFCILIKGGANIHAVDDRRDISVTEALHFCRHGHLWEHALELCGLDVDEVYAIDYNRSSVRSDDLYAPTDQHQRERGPMNIQEYRDKCRKWRQGCATIHRRHIKRWINEIGYPDESSSWTGSCRWPNGMIHEGHRPEDEWSVYSGFEDSSEIEEDNRASTCSDRSSDTEDDSDEEMGGVRI